MLSAPPTATSTKCASCEAARRSGARFCPTCGKPIASPLPARIGEYDIAELVGEGGMGRVYRGLQPRLRRSVCIKTLLPGLLADEGTVARFENEVLTTAALRHPNIVSVYDVGRDPQVGPFMVMEHLQGITLRQVIAEQTPVPWARAVQLIDHVLAGLAEAHATAVIHRDLKPANVMVVMQRDGTENCKVLDFGIARALDSDTGTARLTHTGLLPGTPGYIAPEQIQGVPFDHRVDLYATGAMLYELLCGKRPYSARSDAQLLHMAVREDPVPPSARTPVNVPAALDAVVLKAMARDPARRFQWASELRAALAKVADAAGPGVELELDCMPIADAGFSVESKSDLRSVIRGIFDSESWERAKMIESFGRRLDELFAEPRLDELHQAMQSFGEAARASKDVEAKRDAIAELADVVNAHYPSVVEWLGRSQRRKLAAALLESLGKAHVDRMLQSLIGLPRDGVSGLYVVIRALETPREIIERLGRLDAPVMKRFLEASAALSDAEFEPLIQTGLLSSSHELRLAMLEHINEARAFRFLPLVRQRLHDADARVRAASLRWVCRLEDEGAVRELALLLQRTSIATSERRAIYRTLEKVRGKGLQLLAQQFAREKDEAARAEIIALLESHRMLLPAVG